MPLIQVTAAADALSKPDQDALMSRLSNAVLKSERAPITDPGAHSLVWAHYHELPQGASYVGGKSLEQSPLQIAVTTPEGALNADHAQIPRQRHWRHRQRHCWALRRAAQSLGHALRTRRRQLGRQWTDIRSRRHSGRYEYQGGVEKVAI